MVRWIRGPPRHATRHQPLSPTGQRSRRRPAGAKLLRNMQPGIHMKRLLLLASLITGRHARATTSRHHHHLLGPLPRLPQNRPKPHHNSSRHKCPDANLRLLSAKCTARPSPSRPRPRNLPSPSGNLRLTPEEDTAAVEAAGLYTITPTPNGLRVTLQIPSERYVAAVLSAEAAPDEPSASLAALAIVARTFALTNIRRHSDPEDFDLCDSTHCQALRLDPIRSSIAQAVRDTAGITLWNGSTHASIYYTQNCGGISEAASKPSSGPPSAPPLWPLTPTPTVSAAIPPPGRQVFASPISLKLPQSNIGIFPHPLPAFASHSTHRHGDRAKLL